MADQWYIARNRKKYGPYTAVQIKQLAKTGKLVATDMVLQDGAEKWMPAARLGLAFQNPTPEAAADSRSSGADCSTSPPKSRQGNAAWYYAVDNERQGPISSDHLQQLVAAKKLRPTDLVWKAGLSDWVALNAVPELAGLCDSVAASATTLESGIIAAKAQRSEALLEELPSRRRNTDRELPQQQLPWLLIGGAAGALVLLMLVIGVAFLLISRGNDKGTADVANKAAQQADPNNGNQPGGAAPDQAAGTTYRDPAGHFSLDLPAQWGVMSAEELRAINAEVLKRMPGKNIQYAAGFQPKGNNVGNWPYILVQQVPLKAGRVSYDELERALAKDMPGGIKQVEGAFPDLIKNAQLGNTFLDRKTNRIIIRLQMDVGAAGRVQGLSIGHLGSDAIIFLHCYTLDQDFGRQLPVFEKINNNFQFDQGYSFKPASGVMVTVLGITIAGGTLGAVIGLAKFCYRKLNGEGKRRRRRVARAANPS